MKRLKTIGIILLVLTFVVFFTILLSHFVSEILWWKSVGYLSVYLKFIFIKIISFALPFLAIYAIMNIWFYGFGKSISSRVLKIIIFTLSIAAGVWGAINWKYFIWNIAAHPTGYADPFYGLDGYFYMFRLPLLQMFVILLTVMFVVLFILDLIVRGKRKPGKSDKKFYLDAFNILLFSLSLLGVLGFIFLNLLEQLVIQPHPKVGIGYATVKGSILGTYILMGIIFVLSLIFIFKSHKKVKIKGIILSGIIIALSVLLLRVAYPNILEKYWVEPNELMMQEDYIKDRIEATRFGFNLDLESYSFVTNEQEFLNDIINKARIWDSEPYKKVIKQVQEVKTYFDFLDVDVDKYTINNEVYQVVLSARELNVLNLPSAANTWDNLRLRYTHGYGVALSPANQVDSDGGPIYWIEDLENDTPYQELELEYPQIYYGELTSNYVIVRTTAEEFEYTTDTNRVTTYYEFDKGVPLRNLFRRLVYYIVFKDKMFLLTRYFTKESLILYRRQIHERIRYIFPYLEYDSDPYITIIDGKLYWIIDAYTTSDRFPIAERYETDLGDINYVRNSVKVVVDAYTGDVTYYVIDKTDPILNSYRFIFSELFVTEIPPEIEEHFRYPDVMFNIQADVLCTYHVDNYQSFYNGEDVWKIPDQTFGMEKVPFEPYYLLTKINGEYQFSLTEPFNPINKENLASWLIAYFDDGPHLALKYVERTSSSLGPMQVESIINQDETMSQLFALWGQMGSDVFRGNIQFIPLPEELLYLEPIFLESEDTGIPQLAKILSVVDGNVYSGNNFEELMFNLRHNVALQGGIESDENDYTVQVRDAYTLFLEAEQSRVQGDINAYYDYVDKIGESLKAIINSLESEE